MRNRLDPGSRVVAAQDFRHVAQRDGESVSDYIRRLEQLFRRAYGHEGMSDETRDTLLHGHFAWDCRNPSDTNATGPPRPGVTTGQVKATDGTSDQTKELEETQGLLSCLFSDPEDDAEVHQVRVTDRGSRQLQGVPAHGIIDSGSEITIIGAELFRKVAAVARLRKSQFQVPEKFPRTYDGRSFVLHGRIDLDVSFGDRTMKIPVYVKADVPTQLLLGEGVCRQLQIITYHPSILTPGRSCRPKGESERSPNTDTCSPSQTNSSPGPEPTQQVHGQQNKNGIRQDRQTEKKSEGNSRKLGEGGDGIKAEKDSTQANSSDSKLEAPPAKILNDTDVRKTQGLAKQHKKSGQVGQQHGTSSSNPAESGGTHYPNTTSKGGNWRWRRERQMLLCPWSVYISSKPLGSQLTSG